MPKTLTAMLATLHDPQGLMAPFLEAHLPFIRELYGAVLVIATPATARRTLSALSEVGALVETDGDGNIGENRRRVLQRGLQQSGAAFFHYCDLDRLLYWVRNHREELQQVVQEIIPGADYTALGRTAAAFASHPPVQQELEGMTNEVFSALIGRKMDVTAGSCGVSRRAGEQLVQDSREMSNATDTEWPMLVWRDEELSLAYATVEGLAFETATFYGEAVRAEAHNADNWARRARLARESIRAALATCNYLPGGVRRETAAVREF